MRNLLLTLTVFLFAQLALSSNPIGNCGAARAVPYTLSESGGACNIPVTPGIAVANVDETFFNGGAKCGACYEVTGPLGSTVVQVVDKCDKGTGTGTCSGDVTQFALDEVNAWPKIANRTMADIIYDLGYREVTCDVTGNVKFRVSGTSDYFFELKTWNFRVALTDIRVKADGWKDYEQLKRQGASGIWQWNKKDNNLRFPLTLYLVGTTNELITATYKQSFPSGEADFGDQFTQVAASNGICPMASSPAMVYGDSIGYGWVGLRDSWDYKTINFDDTTAPFAGSASIHAQLYYTGGLQFTRLGGFNALYFSYLTFAARANSDIQMKIYLGDGTGLSVTKTITSQWTVYNISVAELTTNEIESALVFLNLNNGDLMDIWFDSISWELAAVRPGENLTQVTSTGGYDFMDTTGTVVIVDTSTTDSFTFSDSDDTSSAGVVLSNIISAVAFAGAAVFFAFYF